MPKFLQWFTRGLLRLEPPQRLCMTDNDAEFEQVDAHRLDASDFRSSGAMRLDQAPARNADFSDTIPVCSFGRADLLSRRAG